MASSHWLRLERAGLTKHAVNRRVKAGNWLRCAPGVYFADDRPFTDSARVRATVWSYGRLAVASGLAAAWWHGLTHFAPDIIEVTVPRNSNGRCRAGVATAAAGSSADGRRRAKGSAGDGAAIDGRRSRRSTRRRRQTDGLGIAAPCRTAAAVARAPAEQGPPRLTRGTTAAAGRLRRCTVGGRTPAGQTVARQRHNRVEGQLSRWADTKSMSDFRSRGSLSRSTAGRFTAARKTFRIDRERQNNISLLGWQVLRFTWLDLTEYPQRVLTEIRRAISA